MECQVFVEEQNGVYRAIIPALPNLSAEGATREEAVRGAKHAAQTYLLKTEVTTIQLAEPPNGTRRYSTIQDLLEAAGKFKGDEEAMLQHIEEIYAERRRQREEVERELDAAEADDANVVDFQRVPVC